MYIHACGTERGTRGVEGILRAGVRATSNTHDKTEIRWEESSVSNSFVSLHEMPRLIPRTHIKMLGTGANVCHLGSWQAETSEYLGLNGQLSNPTGDLLVKGGPCLKGEGFISEDGTGLCRLPFIRTCACMFASAHRCLHVNTFALTHWGKKKKEAENN